MPRRRDAALALFLKHMKYVNCRGKPHCIDRAVGVAAMILDDFQNSGSPEALERLGRRMLPADLSKRECIADLAPDLGGKLPQILSAAADPMDRFFRGLVGRLLMGHYGNYAISGREMQTGFI